MGPLDELLVSGLLLMVVLLAGVGSVLAEVVAARLVERRGRYASGLVVAALGFAVLLVAPAFGVFVAGLAAYGLALGLVDAASNMQAVAVEHLYGRTDPAVVPRVLDRRRHRRHPRHARDARVSSWPGPAAAARRFPSRPSPRPSSAATGSPRPTPRSTCRGGAIALLGRRHGPLLHGRHRGHDVGTGLPRSAPCTPPTGRSPPWPPSPTSSRRSWPALVGDRLVDRHGAVSLLRISGVVAALSLAVIVFAPTWAVAVVGFTILGGAVATIAPLSFSAAGAVAGGEDAGSSASASTDRQVVARFNQFNYVGALLGAVLTGAVGSDNLRLGFAVPMVLILGIIPLATQFAIIRRRGVPAGWS